MIYEWQNLTYQELARLQEQKPWALLPIGATEQHGPHLPVGTDSLILQGVLKKVIEQLELDVPLLVLPQLFYGKSIEHTDFAGTITLSIHTLLYLLGDIVSSLARHNFRNIIFLNSHGGNADILDSYLQDLRKLYEANVYAIHLWSPGGIMEPARLHFKDIPNRQMHAEAVETSLMYHWYNQLVKVDEIAEEQPLSEEGLEHLRRLEGKVRWGWAAEDLSGNGVLGDPHLASAEAGEAISRWLFEKVRQAILSIVREA